MRYFIIAGEASGDLHGSNLMKGLLREDPQAEIRYWGGPLMDAAYTDSGRESNLGSDYSEGAVMGFSQIILHARKFIRRFRDCCRDIVAFSPDAVILIDYPGFNFRVAGFAHEKGYKVFYYIAPKVWASRESRIKKLKAYVDRLFIVFPFEREYFDRRQVPYTYRGNPLIDAVDRSPEVSMTREEFISANGLPDSRFIAVLAGSRKGEVSSMMPVCMEFADMMHSAREYADVTFLVAGAPSRRIEDYAPYIKGRESYVRVLFGRTYGILKNSAAAVINSGTASLEACLIGTPQVVAYSGSDFNFNIAKQIVRVDSISLGNLILGRKAFRELLQYHFTAENLKDEICRILEDRDYREGMKADYCKIREALGSSGASAAVAAAMIEELKRGMPAAE